MTMKTLSLVSLQIVTIFASACSTPKMGPKEQARVNMRFEETERLPDKHIAGDDTKARVIDLWSDIPEYVSLLKNDAKYKKTPRIVSAVRAIYPLDPSFGKINATVVISFVVSEDGDVEAARVLDSTDRRFNAAAVTAVLAWKFKPAEFESGPTKAFIGVPFQFER